jgi:hypothetical protein
MMLPLLLNWFVVDRFFDVPLVAYLLSSATVVAVVAGVTVAATNRTSMKERA